MENKTYEDKTIVCKDCGKEFIWKAGDQRFYEEKGFNAPVRCKECRDSRKAKYEEKTEDQKNNEFEDILAQWKKNTVNFD